MQNAQLETSRLCLRPIKTRDWPLYQALLRSPDITRYLPKQAPYSDDEIMGIMQKRIQHWQSFGFGTFTMIDKESDTAIGYVGVQKVEGHSESDIRYAILPEYGGKGLTKEAARACLLWTFDQGQHGAIFGAALTKNVASINTLKTIGMVPCNHVQLYDSDDIVYFIIEK
ncbi:GNAT family N-acetyltransferase [Salinibius halmophilus]|uniref:GNAT family N-acetyltransferase n=1 Tax=Salinibius halmophilus TaxID=1853216 RepID=UPI000E66EDA1|nr:GNAT family N-acetyltransferase [Salinibius halmophilus]